MYFTAKWCPPCRRIGPFLAELSEETTDVEFGKVDIDENDEAAQMAGIKSIPTFKFYKVRSADRCPAFSRVGSKSYHIVSYHIISYRRCVEKSLVLISPHVVVSGRDPAFDLFDELRRSYHRVAYGSIPY